MPSNLSIRMQASIESINNVAIKALLLKHLNHNAQQKADLFCYHHPNNRLNSHDSEIPIYMPLRMAFIYAPEIVCQELTDTLLECGVAERVKLLGKKTFTRTSDNIQRTEQLFHVVMHLAPEDAQIRLSASVKTLSDAQKLYVFFGTTGDNILFDDFIRLLNFSHHSNHEPSIHLIDSLATIEKNRLFRLFHTETILTRSYDGIINLFQRKPPEALTLALFHLMEQFDADELSLLFLGSSGKLFTAGRENLLHAILYVGYHLTWMNSGKFIPPNQLQIAYQEGYIHYAVKDSLNTIQRARVLIDDSDSFLHKPFTLNQFKPLLPWLLQIASTQGHTYTPISTKVVSKLFSLLQRLSTDDITTLLTHSASLDDEGFGPLRGFSPLDLTVRHQHKDVSELLIRDFSFLPGVLPLLSAVSWRKSIGREHAKINHIVGRLKGRADDYSRDFWFENNANEWFASGHGEERVQEYSKAHDCYKVALAFTADHTLSLYRLGELYRQGLGVAPDSIKAQEYYNKAVKNGCYESKKQLLFLQHTDLTTAIQWYELGDDLLKDRSRQSSDQYSMDLTVAHGCYERAFAMLCKEKSLLPEDFTKDTFDLCFPAEDPKWTFFHYIIARLQKEGLLTGRYAHDNLGALLECPDLPNKICPNEMMVQVLHQLIEETHLLTGKHAQANFNALTSSKYYRYRCSVTYDSSRQETYYDARGEAHSRSKEIRTYHRGTFFILPSFLELRGTHLLLGNLAQANFNKLIKVDINKLSLSDPFGEIFDSYNELVATFKALKSEDLLIGNLAQVCFNAVLQQQGNDRPIKTARIISAFKRTGLLAGEKASSNFASMIDYHAALFESFSSSVYDVYKEKPFPLRGCWNVIRPQELTQEKFDDLIRICQQQSFWSSKMSIRFKLIQEFLTLSSVFEHVEIHHAEYSDYLLPFINSKLQSLHEVDTTRLSDDELRICFYILRNLIRRKSPKLLDDIRFLLNIQAVQAIAHLNITPHYPNELAAFAYTIGNTRAAELLIQLPEVRRISEQNNFYRKETGGQLSLRRLAQDKESSIIALSRDETRRLKVALDHYSPIIKDAGGHQVVLGQLRTELAKRYGDNPATIVADEQSIPLPLIWEDFLALTLNEQARHSALKSYYQHKAHTALRLLINPNNWALDTSYVDGLRADITNYELLIAMLWLAVSDETIVPTDEHSIESRIIHFIEELAFICRAHNWDGSTTIDIPEKSEEYDDLKGDNPSCYSGMKRRLFQSVLGHPFFKILTKDIINQELREFVRDYFKFCIVTKDRLALKETWNSYLVTLGDVPDIFKSMDISEGEQQKFIEFLYHKYGFLDEDLKTHIKARFCLTGTDNAHVIHFSTEIGLDSLLNAPSLVEPNRGDSQDIMVANNRSSLFATTRHPVNEIGKLIIPAKGTSLI